MQGLTTEFDTKLKRKVTVADIIPRECASIGLDDRVVHLCDEQNMERTFTMMSTSFLTSVSMASFGTAIRLRT